MKLTSIRKGTYRPELDGIRALAIIAVIINHFNKEILPSGFLGVDIFFVISGYVITLSLTSKKNKNFWDFIINFYEKRLKRLAPALIFYVLVISLVYCLIDPNPITTLNTGKFSLLGLSNLHLILISTDYFAQSTQLNAFTHTWSLSVEWQFYIIFPFLFWFTGYGLKNEKGPKNLLILILILLFFSLISFIYVYQINESIAYFTMPTRFWEIATGCLLYIGSKKNFSFLKRLNNISTNLVVVALVGVLFLPQTYFIFSSIIIVLLTSVLILCLTKDEKSYFIFTNKKIIFIGMISYSLYLWHWGVLVISRWTIGVHWWSIPFQLTLIYFLSIFSFYIVEKPFRYKFLFSKRYISLLSQIFLLAIFFSSIRFFIISNYPRYLYFPRMLGIHKEKDNWRDLLDCYGSENIKRLSNPYSYCLKHKRNGIQDKRFYLLGDSHASHFFFMAEKALEKTNYKVSHINPNNRNDFPRNFITKMVKYEEQNVIDEIIKYSKFGDIVAISFHRGRLNKIRDNHIRPKPNFNFGKNKKLAFAKLNFSKLINKLENKGIKVLLIRDTPLLQTSNLDISTCVLQERFTKWNQCEVSKYQDTITRSAQDNLYDYLENNFSNVFIWDPRKYMSSKKDTYSYNSEKGLRMMIDQHHITKEFSLELAKEFKKYIQIYLLE